MCLVKYALMSRIMIQHNTVTNAVIIMGHIMCTIAVCVSVYVPICQLIIIIVIVYSTKFTAKSNVLSFLTSNFEESESLLSEII